MASKKIVAKKVVTQIKKEGLDLRQGAQKLWLAGVGAVSMAKKNVEDVLSNLDSERSKLLKQASTLVAGKTETVREQVGSVLEQVKGTVSANLNWVEEKVGERVGAVMSRLGVPSKADIVDLSKRVNELSKQVKAMQAKRKAA